MGTRPLQVVKKSVRISPSSADRKFVTPPCLSMHQPRSPRTARAMNLGARALILLTIAKLATVVLLGYAIYSGERPFALAALGSFVAGLLLFIAYRVFAASAYCPLCRGPILSGSGAQRNRNARRSFGSHRLRVALDITFSNAFVCPYCNESTLCLPKERPRSGRMPKRRRSASRRY